MARYNKVAIENWRLLNCPAEVEVAFEKMSIERMAMILDAMLACWMAVRIEGENPPETSVPRPTFSGKLR